MLWKEENSGEHLLQTKLHTEKIIWNIFLFQS